MAITLGRLGALSAPAGNDIISVSKTRESDVIDISNRSNAGSNSFYRVYRAGFTTETWEIECHDATNILTAIEANPASGLTPYSVSENIGVDGAVTFTITCRSNG